MSIGNRKKVTQSFCTWNERPNKLIMKWNSRFLKPFKYNGSIENEKPVQDFI